MSQGGGRPGKANRMPGGGDGDGAGGSSSAGGGAGAAPLDTTNLGRIFAYGHGFGCTKLPFSDPKGEGDLKQLLALNQQLRGYGTVTARTFDGVMDAMIARQYLFIGDAQYELHCEMGSQYQERLQVERFQAQLEDLHQIKAAGAHVFAHSFGIRCGAGGGAATQRVYHHAGGGGGAGEVSPKVRRQREAAAARAQQRMKKGGGRGKGKGKKGGGGNSRGNSGGRGGRGGGGGGGGLGLGVVGSKMGGAKK